MGSPSRTRAGSPDTEASCIHEKHRIVRFFLGKRSLLVLRMASCHANQRGRAPRTPKRASGASAQQAHHRRRRGRRAAVRAERVRGVRPGEPMRPVSDGFIQAGHAVNLAAFVDRLELAEGFAGVDLSRTADLFRRRVVHLDPVGDPARQPSHREQHSKHLHRNAHRPVDDP